MKFNLSPLLSGGPEYDFVLGCVFNEPTIALAHHLQALGHTIDKSGTRIIQNMCILPKDFVLANLNLAPGTVIYNQESYGNHHERWAKAAEAYHEHRCVVWELRRANVEHWRREFGVEAKYVPVGWADGLANVQMYAQKPIDLLFYGVLTERRRTVLEYVQKAGYNVHHHAGGPSKENIMGLAKIVMSARAYGHVDQVETIRLIHAMGNGCLCALEGGTEDMGLTNGAIVESLVGLGPAIVYNLQQDDEYRATVAERGRDAAIATGQVMREWLSKAVGE